MDVVVVRVLSVDSNEFKRSLAFLPFKIDIFVLITIHGELKALILDRFIKSLNLRVCVAFKVQNKVTPCRVCLLL